MFLTFHHLYRLKKKFNIHAKLISTFYVLKIEYRLILFYESNISFYAYVLVSNPILSTKKCVISNNNCENAYLLKEKENSLDDCMSFEMCNEFYKIKSLNKSIVNKNESLPKYIQDILKEMYVDELFVSTCQHMVDFYSKYFF